MKEKIINVSGKAIVIALVIMIWVIGVKEFGDKTEKIDAIATSESFEVTLNDYVEEFYGTGCYADIVTMGDRYVYYDVYTEDGELISAFSSKYIPSLF